MEKGRPPALPWATYRFQFHSGFRFDDATALIPYLSDLGISHIYASPFLMARPGSTHGYDITDHGRINPEVGDDATFDRMVTTLHEHGMGLILDFVPNHMGVGGADNPWWLHVLEWGSASPYANFFDIDWASAEPTLKGKVLLPFLGDHYGKILEDGLLKPRFDAERGTFSVWYWEHRFPIAIRDYVPLLKDVSARLGEENEALTALISEFAGLVGELASSSTSDQSVSQLAVLYGRADGLKARLAAMAAEQESLRATIETVMTGLEGTPGDPASFKPLHELLERQAYRVSYWRVATAEINYRRFFDINDLAGLRIEDPELFEVSHRRIFHLIGENKIQGLRLDHIDGLYDPKGYFQRLQDRAAYLWMQSAGEGTGPVMDLPPRKPREHPFYLLVEKILARHERLRTDWPVDGTTGYDFMNLVNGVFVDAAAEKVMTDIYRESIGRLSDFEEIAVAAKRQIILGNLASEVTVLASKIHRLAKQSWSTRDYTYSGIFTALVELISHFAVYRTYITDGTIEDSDREELDRAVEKAREASEAGETSVFDFLYAVLSTDLTKQARGRGYKRRDIIDAAMRFQQVTGPVMAKAVEDTALYRYFRLISLNEVGGEPDRFGVPPEEFHAINAERLSLHPYGMLATATHDHKRGEDVRARINVLSEMPEAWKARVASWGKMNEAKRIEVDDRRAPGLNHEYLLYQTLVGAWPLEIDSPDHPGLPDFCQRIVDYMMKAAKEAKVHTSWSFPNQPYEQALEKFVRSILDAKRSKKFMSDMLAFQARIAVVGAVNSLAQTLLKLTVPGVPDTYQGAELWDLSLVDPDNRRPVDFEVRAAHLAAIGRLEPARLVRNWKDGAIKQAVVARSLAARREAIGLFFEGTYEPLEASGPRSENVLAFSRRYHDEFLIVVVPRLVAGLMGETDVPLPPREAWEGTTIPMPDFAETAPGLTDLITGRTWMRAKTMALGELLGDFPVALLRVSPPAESK